MSQHDPPSSSASTSMVNASQVPVRYLRAYPAYGVLLCSEHRCGYTVKNIDEHLKRAHRAEGSLRRDIRVWVESQKIVGEVSRPPHYGAPIPELDYVRGWQCNIGDCFYLSRSEEKLQRHGSSKHGLDSARKRREVGAYSAVHLQSWFAKSKDYFIVDPRLAHQPSESDIHTSVRQTPYLSARSAVSESRLSDLTERFRASQETQKEKYRRIEEPQHTSELTPWLRLCKYHEHLGGIDVDLIESSYDVPKTPEDDPFLFQVSDAVQRVLQRALRLLSDLHHVDARRLNTFQTGTLSQRPLEHLQEKYSVSYYVLIFIKLLCYFFRVTDGHFNRALFKVSRP